ncbi:Ig-like domain from next to BRCA1 protein [Popillia japonica]|uniref:Ig-like domain from next to BRCA1 protein n=1 Tax=Popillia japonica TaxID=7064 RepID=A0AAW1LUK0_POPJA
MALRGSSDSDVGRSSGKNDTFTYLPPTTNDMSMNASLLKKEPIPHMAGGESYCKTWEVMNSGTLPWTSSTGLRYAWGSQALKPLSKEVQCPPLQPGQSGKICVLLEIPKIAGTYECYWHFYHEGRRFGHWLGCEVIVDDPPVKNVPFLPSPTYDVINIQDVYELVLPTCWTMPKKQDEEPVQNNPDDFQNPFENIFENNPNTHQQPQPGRNQLDENVKIETSNPFSDSDNQSIISISDSSVNSATSEDFVLLKASPRESVKDVSVEQNASSQNLAENTEAMGNLFSKLSLENALQFDCIDVSEASKQDCSAAPEVKEEPLKLEETVQTQGQTMKADLSSSNGIVQQIPIDLSNKSTVSDAEKAKDDVGYAYVHYKGRKIPISKKHLSPEFLVTAESVPESELRNFNKLKIADIVATEPPEEADSQIFRTSTPSCDANSPPQHQTDAKPTQEMPGQLAGGHSFCSLSMNNNIDCASNCGMATSMTSSSNENRFFVFPQYCPGYEVVPPPLAPVYGYNTVGEVLVNDWTTGLNYTACVRYPNPPNQYYNTPTGNSTSGTSRGCSSIPNSSIGSPLIHSPQSPSGREHCGCRAESPKFEQNATFEMPHNSTRTENSEQNSRTADSSPRTNSRVPDILSGATVVATSAINTARSVFNMFVPPRAPDCGRWQNGHWISTNPESKREKNLQLLHDMGFTNRDLNATLLARYNDEIYAVLSDLLQ